MQVSCSPMARALLQSIPGDGLDFSADPMFSVANLLEAAPLPTASQPLAPSAQDMVRPPHHSPSTTIIRKLFTARTHHVRVYCRLKCTGQFQFTDREWRLLLVQGDSLERACASDRLVPMQLAPAKAPGQAPGPFWAPAPLNSLQPPSGSAAAAGPALPPCSGAIQTVFIASERNAMQALYAAVRCTCLRLEGCKLYGGAALLNSTCSTPPVPSNQ